MAITIFIVFLAVLLWIYGVVEMVYNRFSKKPMTQSLMSIPEENKKRKARESWEELIEEKLGEKDLRSNYCMASDINAVYADGRRYIVKTEESDEGIPTKISISDDEGNSIPTEEQIYERIERTVDSEHQQFRVIAETIDNTGSAKVFSQGFNNGKRMSILELKALITILTEKGYTVLGADAETGEITLA